MKKIILSCALFLASPCAAQEMDIDPQTRALMNIDRDLQEQNQIMRWAPFDNAAAFNQFQIGRDLGRGYTPTMSQTNF